MSSGSRARDLARDVIYMFPAQCKNKNRIPPPVEDTGLDDDASVVPARIMMTWTRTSGSLRTVSRRHPSNNFTPYSAPPFNKVHSGLCEHCPLKGVTVTSAAHRTKIRMILRRLAWSLVQKRHANLCGIPYFLLLLGIAWFYLFYCIYCLIIFPVMLGYDLYRTLSVAESLSALTQCSSKHGSSSERLGKIASSDVEALSKQLGLRSG